MAIEPETQNRFTPERSPSPPSAEVAGRGGLVLVVDDEKINRMILKDLLEARGFEVEEAEDGEAALSKVDEAPVDVVLLDVVMPGIDGFEVCRRLKSAACTAHIPVIMVTSLSERDERLTGIEAGANDFLNKPIDPRDLILRVKNALYAKSLFDKSQRLLARVEAQYQRLRELESLKDNLTHMIVHDLKTPLAGMKGYLELLGMLEGPNLGEKGRRYLEGALETTISLTEMIGSLLDVSRLESGQMPLDFSECDLGSLVEDALGMLGPLRNRADVSFEPPEDEVRVSCDADIIRRVISNIVGNSIKFTPEDGRVRISIEANHEKTKVLVSDEGPGIPREYHDKIFEKFGQVKARRKDHKYSTGLGLAFCKLAVDAHRGEIGLVSEPGKGSTFWFALPRLQGDCG